MVRFSLPSAAVLTCLAFGGCGAGEPSRPASPGPPAGWTTTYSDKARGYTMRIPTGWERARESLTPALTDPREVASVGTRPLRHRRSNCEAFAGGARQALRAADALVTVQERGFDRASKWPDFPPRPRSFGAARAKAPEPGCGDRPGTQTWWLPFTAAGRHFYALVVIGPGAPARIRDEAFDLLNSLRFDPAVLPDWPASG